MSGRRWRRDRNPAVLWLVVTWTLGGMPLGACRPTVSAAESGADTALEGIAAVRSELVTAELRGDRRVEAALYLDDAVLLDPDGPVARGRAAIGAGLREFDIKLEEFGLISSELEVVGELAWDRGRYSLGFLDPSSRTRVNETGTYLMVLRNTEDRGWRIAALIYYPLPSSEATNSFAP